MDSVNLNDSKNAARITLRTEPEVGSTVDIIYKSSSKSILQSFDKTFQVNDVVTVPISGIVERSNRVVIHPNSTQLADQLLKYERANGSKD